MNLLARIRSHQQPLANALVVLFALGWLGLALQPCQAAVQADVAPAAHHHGDGHHATPADDEPPCPHCPAGDTDGCGTGTALECETVGVPAVPSKQVDPPSPDGEHWLLPSPPVPVWNTRPVAVPDSDDAGRQRPPDRSLQQRYCTYLE